MIFRCCDAETTGLPSDEEDAAPTGIMELGWCDYEPGKPIGAPVSMLVDCGIPVTIQARAVHHISDNMVKGQASPSVACQTMAAGDHSFTVAHNVDHEKHYFSPGVRQSDQVDRAWLCTYKTAFRLWPDAPGHKLQELRYFLKLDDADDFDMRFADPPHRAPADAYVCAHMMRAVHDEAERQGINIERLVKWSSGPALLVVCFMKKHKGKLWSVVAREDRPYLEWIYDKSDVKDRDIRATVKYWLKQTAQA